MTLDEAIKHAVEAAEKQEKAAKEWHENQVRKCKSIPFAEMDYTHENECEECAAEHRQRAEWLKELKQLREQTRWIPVSEQLPKKSGNYWCTFGGANIKGIDYYTTESDAKEIFDNPEDYDSEDYEYAGWRSQNVIAWMPLPKPYEPQESEDNEDIPMEYFESGGC